MSLDIRVPLQPKQAELLRLIEESQATWIGYGGSRGGAKSHGARAVMLVRRLKYPGTRGLIFRRLYEQLYENHLKPLFAQYPYMEAWFHGGHRELTLPNGSSIVFGYAEHHGDINAFQGKEYMDIAVDEATHLTEAELVFLKTCNRWPGKAENECKMILTCNPGNVGHSFLKRIFLDRQYHENEGAGDYEFLQARAWDNVEWARAALAADGFTENDYYSWLDDERKTYFLRRTNYGQTLDRLPQAMRVGHLLGSWDRFAGQYFDIFDPAKHVRPCGPISEWEPRWLAIDWGFAHDSACYWNARDGAKIKTYREMVLNGRSPRALAQEIVDRTPENERPHIDAIYLSHDAFAQRTSPDTIALQMGEVFRANGMPRPDQADKDVIGGAALVYELLRSGEWEIDPSCVKLIECLPMVTRDEDDPERTVKFEGDDPYDAIRYAMKMRLHARQAPQANRVQERIREVGLTDPTQINIWYSKLQKKEQHGPIRFGRHTSRRNRRNRMLW